MKYTFSEVFSLLANQKLGALALLGAIVSLLLAGRFEILSPEWISLLILGTILELAVFQDQLIQINEAENNLEDAQKQIEELLDVAEFTVNAMEITADESGVTTFNHRERRMFQELHEKIDEIKEGE